MKRNARKASDSHDWDGRDSVKQGSLFSHLANDSDEFIIKSNNKSLARPKKPNKSKSADSMIKKYHSYVQLYAKQSIFHERRHSDLYHLKREPSHLDLVYLHDYPSLERCFDCYEKWALTNDVTGLTDVEAAANYMAWQKSCLEQHEPVKTPLQDRSFKNIPSDDWHTPLDISRSSEEPSVPDTEYYSVVPVVYEESFVSLVGDVLPASKPLETQARKIYERQRPNYNPMMFILQLVLYALAISSVSCMTCNTILPSLISLTDPFFQQLVAFFRAITQTIVECPYYILIYINDSPLNPVNIFNNYNVIYNDNVIRSNLIKLNIKQNNCCLLVKFFKVIHLDLKQRLLGPNAAVVSPTPCRQQWWY